MKLRLQTLFIFCCLLIVSFGYSQTSLGTIQFNTNLALPSSYNFQEYVFPEPDDQGDCLGIMNNSAAIAEIFFAQTHRHAIDHPLFFLIGYRPALLQIAVTGTGAAPDVQVEGILNGTTLGTLCLAGPANLSNEVDLDAPNFDNFFSVTLPKFWLQPGLELKITAGNDSRVLTSETLKISPYLEMNLVMVNMDILDYNTSPPDYTIFEDFLPELASAIPVSVVRFGTFPETLRYPELIASNNTEQLVRLTSQDELEENNIFNEGHINSVASLAISNMQVSTADFVSTVYFGNTLNLTPGGWGGGRSFVGFDYTDIFIHELGHALSLPHWEEEYNIPIENEDQYLYPYGGETDDGGGRGEAWNFIQDTYEFVDPVCRDEDSNNLGIERSDCMQREFACLERRTNDFGPWDGFGDFSAYAIHRYFLGGEPITGQVSYRDEMKDFQLGYQDGFPTMSLENGQRVYTRDELQPSFPYPENEHILPGQELLEQEVYLIYGSAHPTQSQANIVYEPVKYQGTLPPVIDPTDPGTFADLLNIDWDNYPGLYYYTRDITLKLFYEDGSIQHALVPLQSYDRDADGDFGIWRADVCNFSLVVPGYKNLCKVELYHRPFCIRESEDPIEGNINHTSQNITAENFMDGATLLSEYDCGLISSAKDVETLPNIEIFPNPFNDHITLHLEEVKDYQLQLVNKMGQMVYEMPLNDRLTKVNMKHLPSGVYVALVYNQNGLIVSSKRLIKK